MASEHGGLSPCRFYVFFAVAFAVAKQHFLTVQGGRKTPESQLSTEDLCVLVMVWCACGKGFFIVRPKRWRCGSGARLDNDDNKAPLYRALSARERETRTPQSICAQEKEALFPDLQGKDELWMTDFGLKPRMQSKSHILFSGHSQKGV